MIRNVKEHLGILSTAFSATQSEINLLCFKYIYD